MTSKTESGSSIVLKYGGEYYDLHQLEGICGDMENDHLDGEGGIVWANKREIDSIIEHAGSTTYTSWSGQWT